MQRAVFHGSLRATTPSIRENINIRIVKIYSASILNKSDRLESSLSCLSSVMFKFLVTDDLVTRQEA